MSKSVRICTCLMGQGIDWEDDSEQLHNSWCDGLTDHRWLLADTEGCTDVCYAGVGHE